MTVAQYGDKSPDYATNISNALGTLDAHDHTSGKGTQVPTAGININADLGFGGFNATTLRTVRLSSQSAALSGGSDKGCCYVVSGDLYYNNSAGVAIRITSGGGIDAAAIGGIGGDYVNAGASVTYNDTTKTYVFLLPGGTLSGLIDCSSITVHGTTPGVALDDTTTSAYAFRSGVDGNLWQLSIDTAGTRAVNTSGHYSSFPNALVAGVESSHPCLGINTTPAAIFHAHNASGGPTWVGQFDCASDAAIILVQGASTTSANWRSAGITFYDGGEQWDLGTASNNGQGSGHVGDYALANKHAGNLTEVYRVTQNASSATGFYMGIGTQSPKSPLAVAGGVAIGTYAGSAAAPANGLVVSGPGSFGTSSTANTLDVLGGAAIGTYGGVYTSPSNGLIVSGAVVIGNTSTTFGDGTLSVSGAYPNATATYDLGSSSYVWRKLYVGAVTAGDVITANASLVVNAGLVANSALIPGTTNTEGVGTSTYRWLNAYIDNVHAVGASFTPTTAADICARNSVNAVVARGAISSGGTLNGSAQWNIASISHTGGSGLYVVTFSVPVNPTSTLLCFNAFTATVASDGTSASLQFGSEDPGGFTPNDVAFSFVVIGAPHDTP